MGALFVYSGVIKLQDPISFSVIITHFEILPWGSIYAAYAIPIVEILVGLGVIAGLNWALIALTTMLVIFINVLLYGISQGVNVSCGCFGPEDPEFHFFMGMKGAVYRDLLMLVAAIYMHLTRYLLVRKKLL